MARFASAGGTVAFVKPHGALYNLMGVDDVVAAAVVEAVVASSERHPGGPTGTVVVSWHAPQAFGWFPKAFPTGATRPVAGWHRREHPGGVVHATADVAQRAVAMAGGEHLESVDGTPVLVDVQTLCIHGDAPDAPVTATAVHAALEAAGFAIRSFIDQPSPPS